jgi:hypothetical protein
MKFLLVVGSGVSEGEYINRALVINSITGDSVSGEARPPCASIPIRTFDCTDVIGKVFDDRNLDGRQDRGEEAACPACASSRRGVDRRDRRTRALPHHLRGRTGRGPRQQFHTQTGRAHLPTGYRLTTENPRVQRATRGKMLRFNFGATVHRVVRIDIADGVFEPGHGTALAVDNKNRSAPGRAEKIALSAPSVVPGGRGTGGPGAPARGRAQEGNHQAVEAHGRRLTGWRLKPKFSGAAAAL